MALPGIAAILGSAARALLSEGAKDLAARGGASAGGKVISGMGAGTGNARSMTRMLAGGGSGEATDVLPMTWRDKVRDWLSRKSAAEKNPATKAPTVAEQVAGLSYQQRWDRAVGKGTLLSEDAYAARKDKGLTGGRDRLEESERREERSRKKAEDAENKAKETAKETGKSLWERVKNIGTNPVSVGFDLIASFFTLKKGLTMFGEHLLEGSRDLRKFSSSIATAFAQLDRQELILAGRTARATEGSAGMLAGATQSLREERQPLSEMWGTMKNLMGWGATEVARLMNATLIYSPTFQAMIGIGKNVERIANAFGFGGNQAAGGAIEDFLKNAAKPGGFNIGRGDPNIGLGPAPPMGNGFLD